MISASKLDQDKLRSVSLLDENNNIVMRIDDIPLSRKYLTSNLIDQEPS